ncbi:MAG: dihydroorotate dehydrogenase [Acidimicrobiia bacterium]|nr:MAG: dihydroorotate dehydrogenase [Acidimicrobiia bacterium]
MKLGPATLGPLTLRSPLVAASGTVGSVVDVAGAIDFSWYGAAVAKSVASTPWQGRPAPRLAPTEVGMLNGIGIQNPGIEAWAREVGPRLRSVDVPVWGSAVGETVDEFAAVASGLDGAGVEAIEVNLSCPNLEEGSIWSFDAGRSAAVIGAVRAATGRPVGAKLSPNAERVVDVAEAVLAAGADWVVLTNTALGAAVDLETRRPVLSGVVGGYSGVGMKPLALRCVLEVRRALGAVPIVGCGGVRTGHDVIEYVMAGASAVAIGTGHFERPRLARRVHAQAGRWLRRNGITDLAELRGVAA